LVEQLSWASAGSAEQRAFASGRAGPPSTSSNGSWKVLAAIVRNDASVDDLFWLASKVAAECFRVLSQQGIKLSIKYQMHPFLAGIHRNPLERVWARFKHQNGNALRQNLGADFNTALIDCIVDDQLPLTETSFVRLNFQQILVDNNKRFRLTFPSFARCTRPSGIACGRSCGAGIRGPSSWFAVGCPTAAGSVRGRTVMNRLLFNTHVVTYLLAEPPTREKQRSSRRPPTREATRRKWGDLVPDYLDLLQAVKRSEGRPGAKERDVVGSPGGGRASGSLRGRAPFRFYPTAKS
jgi:hypothetical protein